MNCLSFYNGTLDKDLAIELVKSGRKTFRRYGYAWKGAETKPATPSDLIDMIERDSMIDVYYDDKTVLVNQYSSNDMW